MTPTILISAPYFIGSFDRFKDLIVGAGLEWIIPEVKERLSAEELLAYAGKFDGAICGDDMYTEEVIRAATPRLKVISKWGTGIDSIDLQAAQRMSVEVHNTPGAFTEAVADSVMSYVLAFARKGPWMDREMKTGSWEKIPSRALHECTLGVIGVGAIGKAVLNRANAFGMALLGNDIVEIDEDYRQRVPVKMVDLEALLRKSDFVSLNCDLNPSSHHLIGEVRLARMKPSAVLINTARGQVVDESALIEALRNDVIAGAALDVFEEEPLPDISPLRSLDNVMLAPHNANSSPTAWDRVHHNTLRNLLKGLGVPIPAELESQE